MNEPIIKSPCVRNCCLDDKDVCLGCFRLLEEITGWWKFSEDEKKDVLALAQQRKGGYKNLLKFY